MNQDLINETLPVHERHPHPSPAYTCIHYRILSPRLIAKLLSALDPLTPMWCIQFDDSITSLHVSPRPASNLLLLAGWIRMKLT